MLDIETCNYFHTLMQVPKGFSEGARRVTRLSKSKLERWNAPQPKDTLEKLATFSETPEGILSLISHNGSVFDNPILCYFLSHYNVTIRCKKLE